MADAIKKGVMLQELARDPIRDHDGINELLKLCLQETPKRRPTAKKLAGMFEQLALQWSSEC